MKTSEILWGIGVTAIGTIVALIIYNAYQKKKMTKQSTTTTQV